MARKLARLPDPRPQSLASKRKLAVKQLLESIYREYHHPKFLPSDPLWFAHQYDEPADREVVALIAASFAFGNAASIKDAIGRILRPLGKSPAETLGNLTDLELSRRYSGFVYRWVRATDLRVYLFWIGETLRAHGSLECLWHATDQSNEKTVLSNLERWVEKIKAQSNGCLRQRSRILQRSTGKKSKLPSGAEMLLTSPAGKSSCKRMNLFLRWVCRPQDGIDLGLWQVSPARLIMPVDTHVMQVSRFLNWTKRPTADLRSALQITENLRSICSEDPIRYDFSIVRPGIIGFKEAWPGHFLK